MRADISFARSLLGAHRAGQAPPLIEKRPYNLLVSAVVRFGRVAVEQLDEFGEQTGLGAFQDDADAAHQIALGVHGFSSGEHAGLGELAAGAETAVKLIEFGGRPQLEHVGMGCHDTFHERVRGPVEPLEGGWPERSEKFVDLHAQPAGQFVERAGVRRVGAAHETAHRTLVEPRSCDDIVKRQPIARHQTTKVRRDDIHAGSIFGERDHVVLNVLRWESSRGGRCMYARILYDGRCVKTGQ